MDKFIRRDQKSEKDTICQIPGNPKSPISSTRILRGLETSKGVAKYNDGEHQVYCLNCGFACKNPMDVYVGKMRDQVPSTQSTPAPTCIL